VPELLAFTTQQPIMFILLFAHIFGSAIDTGGVNYREFLIAGIFAQTVIFGATLFGNLPPNAAEPGTWALQHPVVYTSSGWR